MATPNDGLARVLPDDDAHAFDDEITRPDSEWPVPREYRTDTPLGATVPASEADSTAVPRLAPVRGVTGRRFGPGWVRENPLPLVLVLAFALALAAVPWFLLQDGSEAASGRPGAGQSSRAVAPLVPPAPAGTSTEDASTVVVPDVEGEPLPDAKRALRSAGLAQQVRRSESDEPAGVVLEQAPAAGEDAERRSVVVLVVSSGAATVSTPDLVGMHAADAMRAVREAGLQPRLRLVRSATKAGVVLSQQPVARRGVERDSVVTRRVAKAPPRPATVALPRLVGLPVSDARTRLRTLGLRSSVTEVVSGKPQGVVVRQSERAGADVAKGSIVVLEISSGPGLVPIPDVIGLDVVSARRQLEAAGFTVDVVDQPTIDPAEDGIVLDQAPAGGGRAGEGATVTLTVGLLG